MKTKYWFKKYRSLRKYDRMIAFATKQPGLDKPSEDLMEDCTGYGWHDESCLYCLEFQGLYPCNDCKLGVGLRNAKRCCNGLWTAMDSARTWEEWLRFAVEVRAYIKENG